MKQIFHYIYDGANLHLATRWFILAGVFMACTMSLYADIIINELMYNPIEGEDYEYLELHNSGSTAFDLNGAYFNDGIDYIFTQPTVMPADSYLVIARSNVFFNLQYPHVTNVMLDSYSGKLNNGGEHLRLVSAGGSTLCEFTYSDDSPWPVAADGTGASLEYNEGAGDLNHATNWHAGYVGGSPGASNAAPINSAAVRINEVQPSNVSTIEDPDYSDYPDWVELYNDSATTVDLSGHYLTDNLDVPDKWQLPTGCTIAAYGYLVFWADDTIYATTNHGYHLPFKFSADGEEVALITPDSRVSDMVKYDAMVSDISYGRNPTNTLTWDYFSDPTPGAVNDTPFAHELSISDKPIFSHKAGFYAGNQLISIQAPTTNGIIQYTTNGATPDSLSPCSTSIVYLSVTTTKVIRARTYEAGKLASETVTHTYFINDDSILPVISITLDPAYLWDDNIGIYVTGTNGLWHEPDQDYFNFYQDWERPAHIDFFDDTHAYENVISMDLGLKVHGLISRGQWYAQKGMRVIARDRYGSDTIPYQLFNDRPVSAYSEFILRNGGCPDYWKTIIRDGFLQTLAKKYMDIDYQAYRPTVTYLNGAYWGILSLRERYKDDYFQKLYGYSLDEIDLIEEGYILAAGDWNHYNAMESFINTNTMSDSNALAYIDTQMNVDEHINYWIYQIYTANVDWPQGNVRNWRPHTDNGRWRWMLIDLDSSTGTGPTGYLSNHLYRATTINTAPSRLFTNLLAITPYRNKFIQRCAGYFNTCLSSKNATNELGELRDYISPEMERHVVAFPNEECGTMDQWRANMQQVFDFLYYRPTYMRQHIIDYFGLSGTYNLTLGVNPTHQGSVLINHVIMPQGWSTNIYFQDIPIDLKAVPAIGHRFVRWEGIPGEVSNEIVSTTFTADTTVQAIFERDSQTLLPTVITNFLQLGTGGTPYYAVGDIIIPTNCVLQIEPAVEIFMPENASIYVYGRLLSMGTSDFPIHIGVNTNANARQYLYPHYQNEQPARWGAICLENASDATVITHTRITDATHGTDTMRFKAAVSAYRSDLTLDHVIITNAAFPVFTQYGNIMIDSCQLHSTESCDLINVKYADSASTLHCILQGSDALDTDAVDYDEVTSGIICGNHIFDFTGFNSDGIDLGEGADNVLVQSNHIHNCQDKGISIGQASSATIEYNIIHDCTQGIAVKDEGSYANIDHNTFYNNGTAVACFEKNLTRGGGQADIFNSILSASTNAPYTVDEKSGITISYSLSDTDILPGTGNIQASPQFRDAPNNFTFYAVSPCRDSADPAAPTDPDGTRSDMGALYYIRQNPVLQILTPLVDTEFVTGEAVHLSGTGVDDDLIILTNYYWTESSQGALGSGNPLDISSLPVGDNTIYLYGIDSQQATGRTAITISIAPDVTTNGLPDTWETQYWPAMDSGGATNDYDQDGFNNWQEWIAGSNPTNPASVFRITESSIQSGSNGIVLSWPSIPGRYYTLESKELGETTFNQAPGIWYATPPCNAITTALEHSSSCIQYRIQVNR